MSEVEREWLIEKILKYGAQKQDDRYVVQLLLDAAVEIEALTRVLSSYTSTFGLADSHEQRKEKQ